MLQLQHRIQLQDTEISTLTQPLDNLELNLIPVPDPSHVSTSLEDGVIRHTDVIELLRHGYSRDPGTNDDNTDILFRYLSGFSNRQGVSIKKATQTATEN